MQSNPFDRLFDSIEKQIGKTEGFSQEAVDCFYVFLKEGQFHMDGRLIDPDNNPWLMPIYKLKRADILNNSLEHGVTIFKPAQVGASVLMLLLLLWLCIGNEPLQIGYFFPQKTKLESFVKTRFNPLLSHHKIQTYLASGRADSLHEKQIYNSTLRFFYTEGIASVDAFPLQILIFDEVRLMQQTVIEGAKYRPAAQPIRGFIYGSTAGMPNDYMSKSYLASDQQRWHSRCENCACKTRVDDAERVESKYGKDAALFDAPQGLPLASLDIPQFIRPHAVTPKQYEYYCYHTGQTIDPLNGGYELHNPDGEGHGYHFGAMVSPITTATVIKKRFDTDIDRKEFWNATMGKAVVGAAGAMVNENHVRDAKALGLARGLQWTEVGHDALYAGVDARTEELHLVIGSLDAICHIEVIQGENGFAVLEQRLREFGVTFCVMDYLPQTTLTLPLARRNKNVALAQFRSGATVRWLKEQKDLDVSDDVRESRMVLIDQVKAFKHALGEFTAQTIAVPSGVWHQNNFLDHERKAHIEYDIANGRRGFLESLQNVILVHRPRTETLPNTRQKVTISGVFDEAIGDLNYDPHFAYAFMYYRMAILVQAESSVFISGTPTGTQKTKPSKQSPLHFSSGEMCGTCAWFVPDMGYCKARNLYGVASTRPKCQIPNLYQPREKEAAH